MATPGSGIISVAEENPEDDQLRIWSQVQTWATLVDQDNDEVADPATYGDPEHDPGFSIPRGRLGAVGMLPMGAELVQARYGVGFGVGAPYDALGIADTDVGIVDAYGELLLANEFGPTSLMVGIHRIPFSRGLMMSSRGLTFQERSVASQWMGHGRDAGATLTQGVNISDEGMVALRVGAFNGNESFLFDTDPGILLAGRLELAMGKSYQTFDPDLEPALGIAANAMYNPELATTTTRYGGDLLARYKWFTITGEYIMGTIAPGDSTVAAPPVSDPIGQSGLSTQLSFFLPVGERRSGVELAGRLSTFDDDSDSDDLGDVQVIHAGVNWRNVVPFVDLGGGYIHRGEGGNQTLANDTVRLWIQFRPTVVVAGS